VRLGLQAPAHVVEGVGDIRQLVAGAAVDLHALLARGDALGGELEPAQRSHEDLRQQQ
jgi:hypothetical protein